jgi:sulfite reductase (ferredoxin)
MNHRPTIAGARALVAAEIDAYDQTVHRFLDGRVPEHVFLETRLRFGIYGQRQDGVHMIRSKLPLGLQAPDQLEAFADLTERFSGGTAHLTTRQDIQVHFVRLTETPALLRVLDDARLTSREACGNVVRNVTASPLAGVAPGEVFDPTAAGMALAEFLLRLPDGQSLGRKFKIELAGSADPRFDRTAYHDLGLTAVVRDDARGFHVKVGGGLGAIAHEAVELAPFVPEAELLPLAQAVLRVFARHGEKQKRARARLKFLVADWGIARFREAVVAERAALADDPRWTAWIGGDDASADRPLHPPGGEVGLTTDAEARWLRTNVVAQAVDGYAAVQVRVPQGDLTPAQLRGVAALLREHTGDTLRIGADQSLWIRHVPVARLLAVREALVALGLGQDGAGGLADPVTCPGADTCKLGITSPRSLARQIQGRLDGLAQDPRLERLRIHVSGCPNGCATHHVADIGLFGAARTVHGVTAPHFMLVLGGLPGGTDRVTPGAGFGTVVTKLPAARVGEAVERLARLYLAEAGADEVFGRFVSAVGRDRIKALLQDLGELAPPDEAPELYLEHGHTGPFQVVRGTGECAGSIALQADLLLVEADREVDAAGDLLAAGAPPEAVSAAARRAMRTAARALLSTQGEWTVSEEGLLEAYRERIYAAGLVFEGVGHYLLATEAAPVVDGDRLRRRVQEAALLVEEAHSVVGRISNPAPKERVARLAQPEGAA